VRGEQSGTLGVPQTGRKRDAHLIAGNFPQRVVAGKEFLTITIDIFREEGQKGENECSSSAGKTILVLKGQEGANVEDSIGG